MNKSSVIARLFFAFAIAMVIAAANSATAKPRFQTATVRVTERGYEPVVIKLRRGVPARVIFLRTTDNTCATEVIFPDFGIKRALPLNQPVVITLSPGKRGEFSFTCGMNMMRGRLIVQ